MWMIATESRTAFEGRRIGLDVLLFMSVAVVPFLITSQISCVGPPMPPQAHPHEELEDSPTVEEAVLSEIREACENIARMGEAGNFQGVLDEYKELKALTESHEIQDENLRELIAVADVANSRARDQVYKFCLSWPEVPAGFVGDDIESIYNALSEYERHRRDGTS